MTNINLAEAKTQLSALVERAERGERIGIMRRGKLVAELAPVSTPKALDIGALRELTRDMPEQAISAGEQVRQMRDEDRY